MVVRSPAAPPTPWSKNLTQPKIDDSAYVHSFSNIIGDVHVGANALIAPGTSIRADEGGPFFVGSGSHLQDGVVVHGLEQGRVMGDDGQQYSVWIGNNTSITHMALIHGPAYVGDNCFVGFRSTIFNARVNEGCVVMMHTLIQDVEIPPGKYVPSGSIITTQQQADRLPDVQSVDMQFATHVVGINDALRSGYHSTENTVRVMPTRREADQGSSDSNRSSQNSSEMQTNYLDPEVVNQVRQLIRQGYRIGTEHADTRRFQTSSWQSCAPIEGKHESDILAALQHCLADHSNEYVRLIGIDTKSKRRAAEIIIQRPGNQTNGHAAPSKSYSAPSASSSSASSYSYSSSASSSGGGHLGSDIATQIRNLLNQGFKIGTEHADVRRFQTSSWKSCSPIQANRESEVMSALEACMAEHSGEYVRLFGIDTKLKRRVGEVIIQRPNGKSGASAPASSSAASSSYSSSSSTSTQSRSHQSHSQAPTSGGGRLSGEVVDQVRSLLNQGYRVSAEYADVRRFQTSSWKSCPAIQSTRDSDVLNAIESCVNEHRGEYVRIIGIDTKSKRRVAETIIQRP